MESKCARECRVTIQSGEDQSSVRPRYSNDGRWLFVCVGCRVKVYSTVSHELAHTLDWHKAPITSCCINPTNSLQLLTASLDGKMIIWDYIDGSLLREIEFGVPLFDFSVRPGKMEPQLFLQIDKGVMEIDASDGVEQKSTKTEKVIVGFSNDVISNRAVSPADQLPEAIEYIDLGVQSTANMCFSYNGEFILSYVGKKLVVCNILKRRSRSFKTLYNIHAITCHPTEMCVATGNERGEIVLWWQWSHRTKPPVMTVLHWHAHTVADLCFTSDGTYLLSGGEECVLVVWQLASQRSHYRPRLGAQITRVACSPEDKSFAVSLHNNIIQVVSGLDNTVEWTVGGMRRAHTQNPKENGMRTGLVWDPRSLCIVTNSNPGALQWYRPDVDQVTTQLDVTGLNYISRRDDPFVLVTVEHAAFSYDGQWLATVEWRDDGKTTPELRLKFWQFEYTTQQYELNTLIDPPHNAKVTSLTFQPPKKQLRKETHNKLTKKTTAHQRQPSLLAVSTSEDGKFKCWITVEEEDREEEDEKERGREVSWACQSVGYYHSLPSRGACFSQDGSLLAVNFKKFITLWDPYTSEIRKAFNCPFPPETFIQHTFGSGSSAHYLLGTSDHHLIVWDLLSCSVLWSVGVDVDCLVADPTGPIATAFVPSKQDTTHLYRFNPSSPTPLSVWESVCSGSVSSAMYAHTTTIREWCQSIDSGCEGGKGTASSTLYFQTSTQVLYRVLNEGEDPIISATTSSTEMVGGVGREERSRQAYLEVFGDPNKGEMQLQHTREDTSYSMKLKNQLKILDTAPHTLPPLTTLTSLFLNSLLPPQRGKISRDETEDKISDEEPWGEEEGEGETGSIDSDQGLTTGDDTNSDRRRIAVDTVSTVVAMETDAELTLPGFKVANFDWLTREHFGSDSR